MGIKSILLSLTALVLGVLLFTNVVSAQDGYCNSAIAIAKNSNGYTYWVPYPSYQSKTNCLMNIGAKGGGVESLQRSLNQCYAQSLTEDGKYGQLTKDALKVAQKKVGTKQDGVFGPATGRLIGWWAGSINGGPTKCVKVGNSV